MSRHKRHLPFYLLVLAVLSLVLQSVVFAQQAQHKHVDQQSSESYIANFEITNFAVDAFEQLGQAFEQNRRTPSGVFASSASVHVRPTLSIPVKTDSGPELVQVQFEPHTVYADGVFQEGNQAYHFTGVPQGGISGDFARLTIFRNDDGKLQFRGLLQYKRKYFSISNAAGDTSSFFGAEAAPSFTTEVNGNVSVVVSDTAADMTKTVAGCGAGESPAAHDYLTDPGAIAASGVFAASGGTTHREVEVSVDHDDEFYAVHGDSSAAESSGAFNIADGIFRSQLGLTLKIKDSHVWTDGNDPYRKVYDPETDGEFNWMLHLDPEDPFDILIGFLNLNNLAQGDLEYLFTYRKYHPTAAGIAYYAMVCDNFFNVGAVSNPLSTVAKGLTLAHELGHSFDARHTFDGPSLCPDETDLMCWHYQETAYRFVQSSIDTITSYAATRACLATVDARYKISGTVTSPGGAGIDGVTVSLSSGDSTSTDTSGAYIFDVAPGSYMVSFAKADYAFSPSSAVVDASMVDVIQDSAGGMLPTVTQDPTSFTTLVGLDAEFSCAGTGDSLQWQKDSGSGWNDLAGATTGTVTVSPVTADMNGDQFRCESSNFVGSATSASATLSASAVPTLSSSVPSVIKGEEVTISLSSTIPVGHTAVWKKGAATISTSTAQSILDTVALSATYTVEITHPGSSSIVTTNSVDVTAYDQPAVTLSASTGSLAVGESAVLTASGSGGNAPYTHSFFRVNAGGDIPLQNGSAASTTVTADAADAGSTVSYFVTLTDSDGRTVQSAQVSITIAALDLQPPVITKHPEPVSADEGMPVALSVIAETSTRNSSELTYQWLRDGEPVVGAVAASLTIPALSSANEGAYSVVVMNADGLTTTSNTAQVSIEFFTGKLKVKFAPKKMKKAKPAGKTIKARCKFRIRNKKERKALLLTGQIQYLLDEEVIATLPAKKGRKYRHRLASDDSGKTLRCAVVEENRARSKSNSVELKVK